MDTHPDLAPTGGAATGPDRLPRSDPDWGWEFRLEDFVIDRLDDDATAAAKLADPTERAARTAQVTALRRVAIKHTIYVNADGWNAARCYTCEAVHGVPCVTLRALASLWADHPDHPYPGDTGHTQHEGPLYAAGSHRRLNWPDPT